MQKQETLQKSLSLPEPSPHELLVLEELSAPESGFLRRVSRRLQVRTGQQVSEPFVYDEIDRRSIDAVVVVPYFRESGAEGSTVFVVLRSALRPPVVLRDPARSPIPEPENRSLWEVPAGLVEPEEISLEGLRRAASRELLEEAGFEVPQAALEELGPSSFPCPGVLAERHFYFRAEVRPSQQKAPSLDGSALEEAGELVAVPLEVALRAAREGRLADAKTELALRRLKESLETESV